MPGGQIKLIGVANNNPAQKINFQSVAKIRESLPVLISSSFFSRYASSVSFQMKGPGICFLNIPKSSPALAIQMVCCCESANLNRQLPTYSYLCKKNTPLDIVHPLAQAYAENFTSAEPAALQEISSFAKQHPQANMLSGHVQGKFLELMSSLIQPNRILEIGTFLGYSALCLAKGLGHGGRLHTIELNPADAATAMDNFRKAGESERIILHLGNALDIIPGLAETWDLVFIDADKLGYPAYYELVLPKVRSKGMIIADNVLFHGEVLGKHIPAGSAAAIHTFNELVKNDPSVDHILLTLRDGLLLVRKK